MKNEPKPETKDEVGFSSTLPGSSVLPGTRRPRNPDLSYCPILTFEEHHKLNKNIKIPYECPNKSTYNRYTYISTYNECSNKSTYNKYIYIYL